MKGVEKMAKRETIDTTYFDDELEREQGLRITISKYGVGLMISVGSFAIYANVLSYKNKYGKVDYFVAFPNKKTRSGEYKNTAYSWNTKTTDNILGAVFDALEENKIKIEEVVE